MVKSPEILTPLQKETLKFLFSDPWFEEHFYLTGGTALAGYYLFHRFSEDLDFFTHEEVLNSVPSLMEKAGKKLGIPIAAATKSPSLMRFTAGKELKLDFVKDVDFRVGTPVNKSGIRVDNLKNIAVNKVCTLLGRLDAKDYIDLYFLLGEKKLDVFELIELGQKKDGGLDPFIWASLLTGVEKLVVFPKMVRPVDRADLQQFFLKLRDTVLDRLNPLKSE